jgi:hypothetical protein
MPKYSEKPAKSQLSGNFKFQTYFSSLHRTKMKIVITFLFAIATSQTVCLAQVENYYISPDSTYPGIKKIHSGHLVTIDKSHISGKKLLISIGGTGSYSGGFKPFDSVAALKGYHAISIDYPNSRNTATFVNSTDKAAFDKFRQELDFGTPVSDSVDVDTLNSIVNRITRLVIYLNKTRPAEGWNNFLENGQIRWDRITLAGHSQGAGHVGYIGHAFKVHKVIMLSGPQDFLESFNMPAPWLSAPSKTPYSSYYALLHDDDFYHTQWQIRNDLAAMHSNSSVIYHFQNMNAFPKQDRILISGIPVQQNGTQRDERMANHISTVTLMHSKAWTWLLNN